jgi:MFS family permease
MISLQSLTKPHQSSVHTISMVAYLAASSAPTPIYRLYQQAWGFSSLWLTVIFAAYAMTLLVALLTFGKLSDHIGRKPVILGALTLQACAMGIFIVAKDMHWLITARLLQGLATGVATAALSAALLDINRARGALINSITPMFGMALGALGSGLLLQIVPDPLHFVFYLLLLVFIIQIVLTYRCDETGEPTPGALKSLRPSMAIPVQAKRAVYSVLPLVLAGWALGGFYLSLMPSLINQVTGTPAPWMGGVAVAILTLTGAASIFFGRDTGSLRALGIGAASLFTGPLVLMIGVNSGTLTFLLIGSFVTGLGFGIGFLGALRIVMPLAKPNERAGLTAAFYAACYLANSLPALAAGYGSQHIGLVATANIYLLVITLMAGFAGTLLLTGRIKAEH